MVNPMENDGKEYGLALRCFECGRVGYIQLDIEDMRVYHCNGCKKTIGITEIQNHLNAWIVARKFLLNALVLMEQAKKEVAAQCDGKTSTDG